MNMIQVTIWLSDEEVFFLEKDHWKENDFNIWTILNKAKDALPRPLHVGDIVKIGRNGNSHYEIAGIKNGLAWLWIYGKPEGYQQLSSLVLVEDN